SCSRPTRRAACVGWADDVGRKSDRRFVGPVVEVVVIDLEVPGVGAITTAVDHHVAGRPAEFGRLERNPGAFPAAVHADDGVGHGHTPTMAQAGPKGASRPLLTAGAAQQCFTKLISLVKYRACAPRPPLPGPALPPPRSP